MPYSSCPHCELVRLTTNEFAEGSCSLCLVHQPLARPAQDRQGYPGSGMAYGLLLCAPFWLGIAALLVKG
jgi:hypothetical protein